MDYQKHYNRLIKRAQDRILIERKEEHHIIPECFFINRKRKGPKGWLEGNPNAKENLVDLTPEEHYTAHQLLAKIYPNHSGLQFAMRMLCVSATGQIRNNKEYGWIKNRISHELSKLHSNKIISAEHKLAVSIANTGEGNYWYGKTWEDVYGIEEAAQKRKEFSTQSSLRNTGKGNPMFGKTWEEKYGIEESNKRKLLQSNPVIARASETQFGNGF